MTAFWAGFFAGMGVLTAVVAVAIAVAEWRDRKSRGDCEEKLDAIQEILDS